MSSEIKANKLSPGSGNDVTMGDSGDKFTFASGSEVDLTGVTKTGFPATATNAPAWHVGINSATQNIPDASQTIVELDDVKFNSGFTWDTANYKGIPGTAGKYVIGVYADFDPTSQGAMWVYLYKNTTSIAFFGSEDTDGVQHLNSFGGTTIVDLNDTDYVQMKVYIDFPSGTATIRQYDATQCVTYMLGFKLMGI